MQSRVESFVERSVDTTSAVIISWMLFEYVINPYYYGVTVREHQSIEIVTIFTVVSFIRGYFWRGFFTRKLHKCIHQFLRGKYNV